MDNRQRPESKRTIIEKTIEILQEDGTDSLSMRKVAAGCGCSVSTLYHHFSNKGELMLYASVPYLRPYLEKVSTVWDSKQNKLQKYFKIEEIFAEYSFREPSLMFNLYFGPKSDKVDNVIANSFRLFTDWYSFLDEDLYRVLTIEGGISERNMEMLQRISKGGFLKIKDQAKLEIFNNKIVHIYRGFLNKAIEWEAQNKDANELIKEYLKIHRFAHEPYLILDL